jgi:hypothetical protein
VEQDTACYAMYENVILLINKLNLYCDYVRYSV